MRLIDADIFREELEDEIGAYPVSCGEKVLRILQAQPTVNQWIPCSERLPEKNGEYLVTRRGGVDIDRFKDFAWQRFLGNLNIAWQPLPKPYKEQRNEKPISEA